ncbi:MAG: hypothetical protein ACI9D0_001820, partial [Bacteroidia bacterium]
GWGGVRIGWPFGWWWAILGWGLTTRDLGLGIAGGLVFEVAHGGLPPRGSSLGAQEKLLPPTVASAYALELRLFFLQDRCDLLKSPLPPGGRRNPLGTAPHRSKNPCLLRPSRDGSFIVQSVPIALCHPGQPPNARGIPDSSGRPGSGVPPAEEAPLAPRVPTRAQRLSARSASKSSPAQRYHIYRRKSVADFGVRLGLLPPFA